jgi:hypothetical protein
MDRLTMTRVEIDRASERVLERVLAVSQMGKGSELERARKLRCVDEVLEDVVLYASAVRELMADEQSLEAASYWSTPSPILEALEARCTCGRERGDHANEEPYAVLEDELADGGPICLGFVPADRSTERPIAKVATRPPPAPAAEVPRG